MNENMMTKAEQVAAEEQEALELEGIERIPEELIEYRARYKEIADQMKILKAEQDAIKDLYREYMFSHHTGTFTLEGVTVTTLSDSVREEFDLKKAKAEIPEIIAGYITTKHSTTLRIK